MQPAALEGLNSQNLEIEIAETREKIKFPLKALHVLVKKLKVIGERKPVSKVPIVAEMTTKSAADYLWCSRPHLVKLLENGEIAFTKDGQHRRVKSEDVVNYKKRKKAKQKDLIIDILKSDEEIGLYDS